MNKRVMNVVLLVIVILFELLPNGVIMVFAPSPTEKIQETYSYFSLTPLGYGIIFPSITGVLSLSILIMSVLYFIVEQSGRFDEELRSCNKSKNNTPKIIYYLTIIAFITSLLQLFRDFKYITLNGVIISLLLCIQIIWYKWISKCES